MALEYIFRVFWLLLPAGFANMSPILFSKIPFLNFPIHKTLLGKNKTWRGFTLGVITAIVIAYVQSLLPFYDYSDINIPLFGFLLGFGAMAGDLAGSFIKRRLKIPPGKPSIPLDQIDWIIGAIIFISIVYPTSILLWLTAILIFGLLHPLINMLGYTLKLKKNKF